MKWSTLYALVSALLMLILVGTLGVCIAGLVLAR